VRLPFTHRSNPPRLKPDPLRESLSGFTERQVGVLQSRFANTHVRINHDMLKTSARERRLFELCLETAQPCVIDNTNPLAADRAAFIAPAKARGFRIVGYFFDVPVKEALALNASRLGKARVQSSACSARRRFFSGRKLGEGFDELNRVQVKQAQFIVTGDVVA
jgi:hypothetical protein